MSNDASDPVYEAIAAFAAGLVEHGVRDVVISPGSRSTPLSVTLHAQPALTTWIQLDERSAGFFALGQARATGRPSVLVCTSGTAAANYLPAVVEAHHAGVPLIVCTADRPPELRDWGAGQTIDQVKIFGTATRWAAEVPVTADWTPAKARLAAHRAVDAATADNAGPVHLNWPLREPLEPVDAVPVVAAALPTSSIYVGHRVAQAPSLEQAKRGVIVVGPDIHADPLRVDAARRAVDELAAHTGWPIIGEPISGVRRAPSSPAGSFRVATAEHLLKIDAVAAKLAPDLVVRVGGSPTTKPVRQWLERHRARQILIDPARRWNDASFTVSDHVAADPALVLDQMRAAAAPAGPDPSWLRRWQELDTAATAAIEANLGEELSSPLVVRTLADALPAGSCVMTSNSMPVRDLDAFVPVDGPAIEFVGNRGASGIDGITSTALGLASRHDGPVVLFTGDIALLHDLGALFGATRAGLHLTILCIDNDGGGIFSMLPIAARGEEIDFETLFRTRHELDLAGFDGIGGVAVTAVGTEAELREALDVAAATTEPGVSLLLATIDRDTDIERRRSISAAVADAVR